MYRPWIVRAVALLLLLVGLQAGAFRDLDTQQKRIFGIEDYSAAMRPEARQTEALPAEPPGGIAPQSSSQRIAAPAIDTGRAAAPRLAFAPRFHPSPTGPPRA